MSDSHSRNAAAAAANWTPGSWCESIWDVDYSKCLQLETEDLVAGKKRKKETALGNTTMCVIRVSVYRAKIEAWLK